MAIHISRARFAVIVAVVLALFVTGVVAGAAGSPLIIGGANQAGTTNTSLNTTSSGFAWQMNQLGSGVGVFAISQDGNALAALAHNGNKYGLSATNDGAAGTGAAVIADGRNNVGIEVKTNGNSIPPLKVNSQGQVANLNADEVDGWDAGCPTGTVLAGAFCIETSVRGTANVFTASETCANVGSGIFGRGRIWRLPTALELRAAQVNGLITVDALGEWSQTVFYDGAYQGFVIEDDNNMAVTSTVTSKPYRCAALPISFDPPILFLSGSEDPETAPFQVAPASESRIYAESGLIE